MTEAGSHHRVHDEVHPKHHDSVQGRLVARECGHKGEGEGDAVHSQLSSVHQFISSSFKEQQSNREWSVSKTIQWVREEDITVRTRRAVIGI